MYRVQQAFYTNNSMEPHFEYTVTAYRPEVAGFKSEKLNLDGQELTVTGNSGTKRFTWPSTSTRVATLA